MGREADENDPYAQELAQVESELEKDNQRLREYAGQVQLEKEPH